MGRADRRRRTPVVGPLRHTGSADQIAGARWARRDPERLSFHTLPWPVWLSAGFMVAVGVWVGLSALAERNAFGVAGVMFFIFAGWIAYKAPRERTVLTREPGALRIEYGVALISTRRVLPFGDIDGFAVEVNRPRNLFRVVAVSGAERVAIGRSFVGRAEAAQRVGLIAEWLGGDGPPVDRRLEEIDDDQDDD